jgi:glycosyltransferase 2 family protein
MMRTTRFVLLAVGMALTGVLWWKIGLGAVLSACAALSWRLLPLVTVPAFLMVACDTLGWRFAFRRDRASFRTLLSVRLAGEAVNLTTPTASVGGEAVKAWLLRPYLPLAESLPSIIIAKTTMTISQALFLLLGLRVAWVVVPAGSVVLDSMLALLALECMATAGFVAVQVGGAAGAIGRVLERMGLQGSAGRPSLLRGVDAAFSHFYRHEPRRFGLSVGWHLAGWILGILESYLILHALGLSVSLGTATVIDAFGSGIGFAAFLVPARLGAQEAGDVAIFTALGFGAPVALAFTLVRRLREALWAAIGFLALFLLERPSSGSVLAIEPEI